MVAPLIPSPERPTPRGLRAAVEAVLARQGTPRLDAWTAGVTDEWAGLIVEAKSRLVRDALRQLALAGDIPLPILELGQNDKGEFIPGRRFRADIAWKPQRVYVEVDGGTYLNGRHARGSGISTDCEKYSLASGLGWRVVRIDSPGVREKRLVPWVRSALAWKAAS